MKKYKYLILISILVLILSSCKSSFTEADRTKLKDLQNELINNNLVFKADAALPFNSQAVNNAINDILIRNGNSASRISLSGDNYTLKIAGEKAVFNLPFYGERRTGGGYNDDNSFDFTGEIKNVSQSIVADSNYISYEFDVRNDTESLSVELKIFSRETAHLIINSSQRSYIKYDGHLNIEPTE
ncbi:DUF4251 domain-containing protein [Nonlabens sp. Asnod3-A02]|uniref:DUF4251 domain-containing protein n=1 Tax=Nonlabens sp. Asnod3-A02 TaxID=3160579 RepID=UPI00386FC148